MRHDSERLLLCLRWWDWQPAPLHTFIFFLPFLLEQECDPHHVGTGQCRKDCNCSRNTRRYGVWVVLHVFHEIMRCLYIFYCCVYLSNTCICVCFCRRSPGCDTHCGIYQDRDEARQIPSDYLWPGWWEENPRHLEELLHNVSWRGVCGGLHWCRQDPRDEGNLNRGPRPPVHLREACASVSHSRSLSLIKLNTQNLWRDRNVSV